MIQEITGWLVFFTFAVWCYYAINSLMSRK